MVSRLFEACVKGDLQNVMACLETASPADLEVKDHTGCTPLIEAIKNGHVEIVDALLKKGADPHNRSEHAQPEQYTTDVAILELLAAARDRRPLMDTNQTQSGITEGTNGNGNNGNEVGEYIHDMNNHAQQQQQHHHHHQQAHPSYYPTLNGPPQVQPDGTTGYYGPPPPGQIGQQQQQNGENGTMHLPPPDVARMIPCRYFPACRYGASCMFLHPTGPYYPPPPPGQYGAPGYDPSVGPYPVYYPAPPPPPHGYGHAPPPPPNGVIMSPPMAAAHSLPPPPPPHAMVHSRSASELTSPQHPYSPPPPPMGYAPMPSYPPPVHMMPPPPPPPPHMNQQPQSPHPYPSPPYPIDPSNGYHSPNGPQQPPYTPTQPQQPQSAGPDGPTQHFRGESFGGGRRGGAFRRGSIGRKPPCFFYPVGKCKNGDDCRFPHVLPNEGNTQAQNGYPNKNGNNTGPHGRRSYQNGGTTGLEEKMRNMSVRENGYDNRSRFPMRNGNGHSNRFAEKKSAPAKVQRVPNPDEFPVLVPSAPSRSHSPGSTSSYGGTTNTPTAAQVLQRPAPQYREKVTNGVNGNTKENGNGNGKESSTRVPSPDSTWAPTAIEQVRSEPINGQLVDLPRPIAPVAMKQMSFAAVATAA